MKEEINYYKSRFFWNSRAERFGRDNFLLATTLQDDLPAISDYRDIAEKKHLFRVVEFNKDMNILDLGGGSGRWALDLAKYVKHVTLVDFSPRLLEVAEEEATRRGIKNISFIESSILDFNSAKQFDIVLVSGVLMYINDNDLGLIADKCFFLLKPEGRLILREGVNLKKKIVMIEEFLEELGCNYSVIWRKPEEYVNIFAKKFDLIYTKDAFPYLIPVFFYKRLIPRRYRKNKRLQEILRRLLLLQSHIDSLILKYNLGLRLYHWWLKKKAMGVNAQLYVFRKSISKKRNFYFAGRDVVEITKDKITPFYLVSEEIICKNYESFISGFKFSSKPQIYYSVKTNYELNILKSIKNIGLGAEIGSELDLFLADRAGFVAADMVLDGFYKKEELLRKAIKRQIRTINVETLDEIKLIDNVASKLSCKINLGLRLNLNLLFGDWRNFITDRNQKTFGIKIKEILSCAEDIGKYENIVITTLMWHTAKSFTTPFDYKYVLKKMFWLAYILEKKGIKIKEFNLGGGIPSFASKYELRDYSTLIDREYHYQSQKYHISPGLSFELGRSLVDNAVVLIGRVCEVRDDIVIVDMSRSDFGFSFPFRTRKFIVADKFNWQKVKYYRVWSSSLEKFDVICRRVKLPYVGRNDTVVLFNVGAYSIPLSTQFIKPRCGVYFLKRNGEVILSRAAESFEDVIYKQVQNNNIDG